MKQTDGYEVGRELDAMIAAEVMGWSNVQTERWGAEPVLAGRRPTGELAVVPHYSTNMADTWKVVTTMRREGWMFSMTPGRGDNVSQGVTRWDVVFARPLRSDSAWDIEDERLAICVAALRAVRAYRVL